MIPYSRSPRQMVPASAVKIIGVGGAGTNMLERIALDGMEGSELLALNTDIRTLSSCLAQEKIQLGANLTKGLGSGGDPDLGRQSVLEAEDQIRAAIKGHSIVFLCTGLGGGTGSGAAPIVTRLAREEGAFVVVFATMPFAFEGRRRREQAETSLNELAVLSNALVTFDNNRMGELVLAKQGIHEAFSAADHMICESIKAVIRLVSRPGLINVGLDDLMSALRTNRSRCLFGSGIASGKDRATSALKNALASPLLDQGTLLKDAQTLLVHLSGGEDLTLFEIELLMQRLQKFVPEDAHVLFGAAIDPAMGDSLSITLISALPEDSLALPSREPDARQENISAVVVEPVVDFPASVEAEESPSLAEDEPPAAVAESVEPEGIEEPAPITHSATFTFENHASPKSAEEEISMEPSEPADDSGNIELPPMMPVSLERKGQKTLAAPWGKTPSATFPPDIADGDKDEPEARPAPDAAAASTDTEAPKLKLGVKASGSQSELSLDSAPRGRFEGETPNVFEGEDLDLPPFLRKKK